MRVEEKLPKAKHIERYSRREEGNQTECVLTLRLGESDIKGCRDPTERLVRYDTLFSLLKDKRNVSLDDFASEPGSFFDRLQNPNSRSNVTYAGKLGEGWTARYKISVSPREVILRRCVERLSLEVAGPAEHFDEAALPVFEAINDYLQKVQPERK